MYKSKARIHKDKTGENIHYISDKLLIFVPMLECLRR